MQDPNDSRQHHAGSTRLNLVLALNEDDEREIERLMSPHGASNTATPTNATQTMNPAFANSPGISRGGPFGMAQGMSSSSQGITANDSQHSHLPFHSSSPAVIQVLNSMSFDPTVDRPGPPFMHPPPMVSNQHVSQGPYGMYGVLPQSLLPSVSLADVQSSPSFGLQPPPQYVPTSPAHSQQLAMDNATSSVSPGFPSPSAGAYPSGDPTASKAEIRRAHKARQKTMQTHFKINSGTGELREIQRAAAARQQESDRSGPGSAFTSSPVSSPQHSSFSPQSASFGLVSPSPAAHPGQLPGFGFATNHSRRPSQLDAGQLEELQTLLHTLEQQGIHDSKVIEQLLQAGVRKSV
eukprot:ANDGO_06575.mRNA.1 hypothetical protein